MKILFKYASRSRRNNFFRGLDSIVDNLANKEDYHIMCTLDADDKQLCNTEVVERIEKYKNISYYYGISHSKVYAINRDLAFAPIFDILINFSDDMIFTQWGFDDIIRTDMQQNFPDTDGFLHYHDGNQPRLATMSIIGKKHFDRTNLIYPDDYISVYCDNHVQEYAQAVGKYKYFGDSIKIMMHLHPLHGHGLHLMDEQYKHTESFYNVDRETYFKHKENNFGVQ